MTKTEFIVCVLVVIVCILTSVKTFSDIFAERLDTGKKMRTVIALILLSYAALSVAVFVDCLYYGEIVWLRFGLVTFSVYSITIGMSAILGVFKRHWDDGREYRELKKSLKETDKYIRDIKEERLLDGCMTVDNNAYSVSDKCMAVKGGYMQINDTYTVKENLALKSNCCEMVGRKVISIEEARRKRK